MAEISLVWPQSAGREPLRSPARPHAFQSLAKKAFPPGTVLVRVRRAFNRCHTAVQYLLHRRVPGKRGCAMKQYRALDIAEWFLAWAEDADADISNLKLQKLLYYAQGHYLARFGRPLFSDEIQAWAHGPVIPDLYHSFKGYGRGPIDSAQVVRRGFSWDDYKDVEQFLMDIWDRYGSLAAWTLREKTHRESPWRDAFEDGVRAKGIPQEGMRTYFSGIL